MNQVPKDPFILLSFLNTKLRDRYAGFAELCEDLALDESSLLLDMERIGYRYSAELNQFIPADS